MSTPNEARIAATFAKIKADVETGNATCESVKRDLDACYKECAANDTPDEIDLDGSFFDHLFDDVYKLSPYPVRLAGEAQAEFIADHISDLVFQTAQGVVLADTEFYSAGLTVMTWADFEEAALALK